METRMVDRRWGMKPNKAKAMMLAKRQLAEFACDAVNLEGLNFTLPEIQTLLDGVTVGGYTLSDQQIAVNQGAAWRTLFKWIEQDVFGITPEKVCAFHAIAGKEEALEWGNFPSGGVAIAGTDYMPPEAVLLPERFIQMTEKALNKTDVYDQAICLFLAMARSLFFYDVNKRMGRFIMNGHLLNNGYPAINVSAKKQLAFNRLMLNFYETEEMEPMNLFMRSCLDHRIIEIMKEGYAIG
jgi:Fic family protein